MRCIKIIGLLSLLLFTVTTSAQEESAAAPLEDGLVLDLPVSEQLIFPDPEQVGVTPLWWQGVYENEGSRYLRLEFSGINPCSQCDFEVEVKNSRGDRVFSYHSERFSGEPFWTGVIPGDTALVELRAQSFPDQLRFQITTVVVEQEGQKLLSIVGDPDFKAVYELAMDDAWLATGVAKLAFIRNGRAKTCTGFLIADDLMLTNEHCVNSDTICATTVALFGYQLAADGSHLHGAQYECLGYLDSQYERDFSLLQLRGNPGGDDRWAALRLCDRTVETNETLMLIQHPSGRPKEFVEQCEVVRSSVRGRRNVVEEVDLAHDCDTEKGSSGSPVLDHNRDVVGLHHLGFGLGEFRDVNRAVKIAEILSLIEVEPQCSTNVSNTE